MKKLTIILVLLVSISKSYSQQLVRATNVYMVTTAGTKLVLNGGITFIGTSNFISTADSVYLYTNAPVTSADWLDSTATGAMDITSTGNVFMNGNIRQKFYGKTKFYNHFIRNINGDTLLSSCEVRNLLHLDTGFVFTKTGYGNDSLLVSNPATTAIVSTSNYTKSWVNGRLSRTANVATTVTPFPPLAPYYLFPVGKTDSLYAYVRMAKFNGNTTTWTIEYFPALPFDYLNVFSPPVDHISRVENWEINSNTQGSPDERAYVSLSWRGYSRVSANLVKRDSLLVVQYINRPPNIWDAPGGWATGRAIGPDSLSGYVTSNTASVNFTFAERRFTLGTFSKYNALPIRLIYFTAIGDGNKVRLNWDVANEQDVRTYEVEKSLTATNFTHLSTVLSLQALESLYTDYDYAPALGWNYYRIKIIDKSGNFTYSPVRAVKFDKGLEEVKIFPNPATDWLHIQLPSSYIGNVQLQVYGIDGKFISSIKPLTGSIDLRVSTLPASTYLLQIIKNDGSSKTYRFVKH